MDFCHDLCKCEIFVTPKVPTMVGFWGRGRKSSLVHYFGQNLVGFLSLWRNLENLVEILRFIFMIVYNISLSTLNIAAFSPCADIKFSQSRR